MYLPKKPPSPKYSLTPFLFLYVVLLMNGELFSTSSMDRLHVTLLAAPGELDGELLLGNCLCMIFFLPTGSSSRS